MKNKISSLCLVVMFCMGVLSVSAQQVTKEAALEKAISFLQKSRRSNTNARKVPRKAPQLVLANNREEFYIFNDEANGGYVIVSGDERMPEILGYSYDGHFDNDHVPCNMMALFERFTEEMTHLRTNRKVNVRKTSEYDSSWESIQPMLECKWGHYAPNNNLCPEIDDQHVASGCVAIAMAQIMYYHQWPKQTTDIIPGYTTESQGIAIPDTPITTIDWDNMLPYYEPYDNAYTKEQADALATLMMLCNTAVKMDFNLDSSSAYMVDAKDAFWKYFDYDSQIEYLIKDEYEAYEWNQIVYNELSNGRPVMCAEPGHALDIDGYDKEGYFHMNFGEHGIVSQEDGYFLLNYIYEIFIGIQPENPNNPHAYAVLDNSKLTFYYDTEKNNRNGEIFPDVSSCPSDHPEIEECIFDASFANCKLRSLKHFFENCTNLKFITGINNLNTSEVKNMSEMFSGCSSLKSLDLSSFNTEKVVDMLEMFKDCSSLVSLDISNFDTKKVTNMMNMFCYCSSLTSLDVNSFNTENVENMDGLFYDCSSLKILDVSKFKTDKVTDMRVMFHGCSSLSSLDLSSFNTEKVTNMGWMFGSCYSLTTIDLSSFNTDNVKDMSGMFSYCSKLTTIYAGENWDISNVENTKGMFTYCISIVGGAGTVYNWDHNDGDYAHIDGGPSNPGYLTYKENTAIHSLKADDNYDYVYSLSGVRLSHGMEDLNNLKRGLYIVNGKKIIVK